VPLSPATQRKVRAVKGGKGRVMARKETGVGEG